MRFGHAYKNGGDAVLTWLILAVVPVAVLLGGAILAPKGRASRRTRRSKAWSETEVDYKARHDLIPKLEETLEIYAFHRRDDPGNVTIELATPGTLGTGTKIPENSSLYSN
jgi:hypothetical protein